MAEKSISYISIPGEMKEEAGVAADDEAAAVGVDPIMKDLRSRIGGQKLSFKFKLKHLTRRSDDNDDVAAIDIVIGSVIGRDGLEEKAPTNIYLSRVDIDPKWQGLGLCKILLTYCLKIAYRELRKVYGLRFTDVKLSGNVQISSKTETYFNAAKDCYIE